MLKNLNNASKFSNNMFLILDNRFFPMSDQKKIKIFVVWIRADLHDDSLIYIC